MSDRSRPTYDRENQAPSPLEKAIGDYLDQLNEGHAIDPKAVLAQNPLFGQEILATLSEFVSLDGESDDAPPLGTLGDYTLRRQIGRGGMGVVYEAWEGSMDRAVALKVLPAGVAADDRAFQRFMQEAKTAGKLSHANIVPVFFTGMKEQTPFYAMEYVEGETLAQVLGRLKEAEPETETAFGYKDSAAYFDKLARAFADVADGLQHAHAKGVIHRDIKPSNLILDSEGRLRILDFGLARLEGQESLTFSGDVVGTPAYMSPEQAKRRKIPIDHRTDVYSLGATLYELLTHQQPFRGKDHNDTLSQIIEHDPPPPRQLNPRVPQDLETIVLRCLRKDAEDRYGTAEALEQDLRRFVRGDAIEARRESQWEQLARKLSRHRVTLGSTAVVVTVLAVGAVASAILIAREREEAIFERDAREKDLYVSNIRLAKADWEMGNVRRSLQLLERHALEPGRADLKGWEWYYLRGLADSSHRTLGRHTGAATGVSWSPGGERLASGGADGIVKVWDVAAGTILMEVRSSASVRAVAWSPTGDTIAAAGEDGVVRVWQVATAEDTTLAGHEGAVTSVAWSPDGRLASTDRKTVRIWDTRKGTSLQELAEPANCLAWSPGGEWLAGDVKRLRSDLVVWETATWRVTHRSGAVRWGARSMAWSPDGSSLASGGLGLESIKIWDSSRWQESDRLFGHRGIVNSVSWHPGGSWLATVAADGLVKLWDTAGDEEPRTLRGHAGDVTSVEWDSGGARLATTSADGTVKVWDAFAEQVALTLPACCRIAWSPDGGVLAGAVGELDALTEHTAFFDASTGEKLHSLPPSEPEHGECWGYAFSPDGHSLATVWQDGMLRIWKDWAGSSQALSLQTDQPQGLRQVLWFSNTRLATSGSDGVKVWDLDRGEPAPTLRIPRACSFAWDPDGSLVTFGSDGVETWGMSTGQRIRRLSLEPTPDTLDIGRAFARNAQGDRLAAGARDGTLVVWDLVTGEPEFRSEGHTSSVRSVAWSPDGLRLATGSHDHTVRIWDAESGTELLTLRGHTGNLVEIAWHPDGQRLATAGVDCVRVWYAPGYGE